MSCIISFMRTIVYWICGPLFFFLLFPVGLVLSFFLGKRAVHPVQWIAKIWSRGLLIFAGVSVDVKGLENIKERPHIFAMNHQSMFDIVIALAYLPRPFHFIAKESLFNFPGLGQVMRWAGYFPINRSSPQDARRTMDNIVKQIVDHKASILIYPEGTRSPTGELLPFKKGCATMAHQSGAVIYPIGIKNSWKIVTRGSFLIHPCHVELNIGTGIELPHRKAEELAVTEINDSTKRIQEAVRALLS